MEGRSQAGRRLQRTPLGSEVILLANIHNHSAGAQVALADGLVDESHCGVMSLDIEPLEGPVWATRHPRIWPAPSSQVWQIGHEEVVVGWVPLV